MQSTNTLKDIFAEIVVSIITSQEAIIGPVAIERALHVEGMAINWKERKIIINGNPGEVIDELIDQYQMLFGQISVDVCKDAAQKFLSQIPADQMPSLLR